MGYSKNVFLHCDECGLTFASGDQGFDGQTITYQRSGARDEGWSIRPGKDLCPDCRKESTNER